MLKTDRNRIANIMLYFASSCQVRSISLHKLFFHLDFEHLSQTGKSVTGLQYEAREYAPVSRILDSMLKNPPADIAQIRASHEASKSAFSISAKPDASFSDDDFTPRQLRIMESLRAALASGAFDAPNEPWDVNGAWAAVWAGGAGNEAPIPCELAIADDNPFRQELLAIVAQQRMYNDSRSMPGVSHE